jgi:hypothetical protein
MMRGRDWLRNRTQVVSGYRPDLPLAEQVRLIVSRPTSQVRIVRAGSLFDHLVRKCQKCWRYSKTERFRSLEIND